MSYVVGEKTSTAKGRVAEGESAAKFPHRYIDAVNEETGKPTGNWSPDSAAEAFAHYMELFPNETTAKADLLFLINRRFYFDDQPGADPIDKAARELSKKLGVDVDAVKAMLASLRK